MSRLEALARLLVQLADLGVFLWLAIKGLMFVWEGGGGYIIFWGAALIASAVFWKQLDKDAIITSLKSAITQLVRR
jgi:hypothetical protein